MKSFIGMSLYNKVPQHVDKSYYHSDLTLYGDLADRLQIPLFDLYGLVHELRMNVILDR